MKTDLARINPGVATTTADATRSAVVACHRCGRGPDVVGRRHLWGTADGVTTADLAAVTHWVCADCFADPNRSRG